MKIAMFTNNYKPYIGGVPISIENLAKALRELGHEVYIFAPTYKNQIEDEFTIRYPSLPISIAKAPIPQVVSSIFERKILELGIDVIHVHHPALVGNVALYLKKKYGIPVVFTYHTRYEEYLYYIKGLKTIEKVVGGVDKYITSFCNKCDLIVAPTMEIKKYLENKEINDTYVTIIPTGITKRAFYTNINNRYKITEQYKQDADYLFITVSRLAKEKNLDFQLRGFCKLKEKLLKSQKTFKCLIIGDGPYRKEFEKKIETSGLGENLILLGNIENERLADYYAAANAFVFSSKSETQGIVVIEAMAQGIPVIAVNATGVCDIVENEVNGFLTDENEEAWSDAIIRCVSDSYTYYCLSEGARETALKYREENVAKKFEKNYANLCVQSLAYVTIQPNIFERFVKRV